MFIYTVDFNVLNNRFIWIAFIIPNENSLYYLKINLSFVKLTLKVPVRNAVEDSFSSPEQKLRVSYCDHPLSIIRRLSSVVYHPSSTVSLLTL